MDYLAKSVVAASALAAQQIDMTKHNGIHPRLGAVDLIPIHPLSTAVSLEKCGNIANGNNIKKKMSENTMFMLYEQFSNLLKGTALLYFQENETLI